MLCCFSLCRVCNRLSGSNMDLERVGQQGSVENLSQSLRGLNCCTTASTDSLQALSDAGEYPTHTHTHTPELGWSLDVDRC